MAFAIDEINRSSNLLPNVTLGYSLYDNCAKPAVGFRGGISLVRAMIQILKHFGWTWAGLLVSDDDYGLHVMRSFQSELIPSGAGCLAYSEVLPLNNDPTELRRIVDVMRKSTARVVIVFSHVNHMFHLMKEVRAMIQILKHFGWTWAGLLINDDDYGHHAMRSFQSGLIPSGAGCLAYSEVLPLNNDPTELRRIVDVMRKSTARVVIVFSYVSHILPLMKEVWIEIYLNPSF
ncbi:hypothetical protein LDENG_00265790 [Lucifuga dentata]|nr:hypothetical protein LDENG_00265790 [Lucifuga dentata]